MDHRDIEKARKGLSTALTEVQIGNYKHAKETLNNVRIFVDEGGVSLPLRENIAINVACASLHDFAIYQGQPFDADSQRRLVGLVIQLIMVDNYFINELKLAA